MASTSSDKEYWREFIELYKEHPCLWKVKSKEYSDKGKRNTAYEILLEKLKEKDQSVTRDTVAKKINNFRTIYRKELKKVEASEKAGAAAEDIHIPLLWYYDLMHFIRDQELTRPSCFSISLDEENQDSVGNEPVSIEDNSQKVEGDGGTPQPHETVDKSTEIKEKIRTPNVSSKKSALNRNRAVMEDVSNVIKWRSDNREMKRNIVKDEYSTFGEHIACKLRKLPTSYGQSTVQFHINNILYQAELGAYDQPSQQKKAPQISSANLNAYPYGLPSGLPSDTSSLSSGMHKSQAVLYHHDKTFLTGEKDSIFLTNDEESLSGNNFEHLNNLWQEKITSEGLNKADIIEAVETYAENHPEITIKTDASGEQFCMALVTDFMKRCHSAFEEVQRLCYIETALHYNVITTAVTVLMGESPGGAVPLGMIFCFDQEVNSYMTGFQLLKEAIGPVGFYGKMYPEAFMINDSAAIRQALENVWPKSYPLLCSSHLLQNTWRKLFEPRYRIPEDDRRELIAIMKQLIHAKTTKEFTDTFTGLLQGEMSCYKQFINYVKRYARRKYEWSHAYQKQQINRDQANDCIEPTLYIFNHIVMDRCKIYNTASLVMYMSEVFSGYLQQRILDRAEGGNQKLLSQHTIDEFDLTNHSDQTFTLKGKSEEIIFKVDLKAGICSCEPKYPVPPCDHQVACAEMATMVLPAAVIGCDEAKNRLALVASKDQENEVTIKTEPFEDVTIKSECMVYDEEMFDPDLPSTSSIGSEDFSPSRDDQLHSQTDPLSLSNKRPMQFDEMYTSEQSQAGPSSQKNANFDTERNPVKRPRFGSSDRSENIIHNLPTSSRMGKDPLEKDRSSIPTLQSLKEEYLNQFELFGIHVAKELSTILDEHSFNQATIKINEIISKAKSGQYKLQDDESSSVSDVINNGDPISCEN